MRIRCSYHLFLPLLIVAHTAMAQSTGVLRGLVKQLDAKPAGGATVSLSGTAYLTTADAAGGFVLAGLPAGRYLVLAELEGSNPANQPVRITAGETTQVTLTLRGVIPQRGVLVTAQRGYKVDRASAASRMDIPLMQTPAAVQVVDREVVRDQNVNRLQDAVRNVSGVTGTDPNYTDMVSIRGFNNFGVVFEEGTREDQIASAGINDMANVDRVEVLKGPASVLYGQGEPGGTINTVTKKPLDHPFLELEQSSRTPGTVRTTLDASGPLSTDKHWLYRVNLVAERTGSSRDFVWKRKFIAYPSLAWQPNDKDNVLFEAELGRSKDYLDIGIPYYFGKPAEVAPSFNMNGGADWPRYDVGQFGYKLTYNHTFNDGWSLKQLAKFDLATWGAFDLVFPMADPDSVGDMPLGRQHIYYADTRTYNLATELHGKYRALGMAHTAVFGVDGFIIDEILPGNFTTDGMPTVNVANPVFPKDLPALDPANDFPLGDLDARLDRRLSYAFFVQDQMDLPHRFHVLAGMRADRVFQHVYGLDAIFQTPRHPVTPRLGTVWEASPSASVYASYTENLGSSSIGLPSFSGAKLPNEYAAQFEVGVKTEWLEKRLAWSASTYNIKKENVLNSDPLHPDFYITIGDVRSRGFETDVTGAVSRGWNVSANYAYTDTRILNDSFAGPAGQRFFLVPYHSGGFWTTYRLTHGWPGLKLGLGLSSQSSQLDYFTNNLSGFATWRAYASQSWNLGTRKLTAQLNADNLNDARYFSTFAFYGDPRTVSLTLRYGD
ncbi:MAG: TonB-dependent receptor [Candidatus Eisenbacteria bacterium]